MGFMTFDESVCFYGSESKCSVWYTYFDYTPTHTQSHTTATLIELFSIEWVRAVAGLAKKSSSHYFHLLKQSTKSDCNFIAHQKNICYKMRDIHLSIDSDNCGIQNNKMFFVLLGSNRRDSNKTIIDLAEYLPWRLNFAMKGLKLERKSL